MERAVRVLPHMPASLGTEIAEHGGQRRPGRKPGVAVEQSGLFLFPLLFVDPILSLDPPKRSYCGMSRHGFAPERTLGTRSWILPKPRISPGFLLRFS